MTKPVIDPGLRSLMPPMRPEERAALETSIVAEGVREPLIVWQEKWTLLDGHNRFEIAEKHGIDYDIDSVSLPDRESAEDWIDRNALGRRNLTPDQFSLCLGRRYNRAKTAPGGLRTSSGQNAHLPPAEALAVQHGVDESTVRRAGKFVEAVDAVKVVAPQIEQMVTLGKGPSRKAVVAAAKVVEKEPAKAKAILNGKAKPATRKTLLPPRSLEAAKAAFLALLPALRAEFREWLAALPADAVEPGKKKDPKADKALSDEIVAAWNAIAGVRKIATLTTERRKSLNARLREEFWLDHWREAIAKIPTIPGFFGKNNWGWTCDWTWFTRPNTVPRLIEGYYDKWTGSDEQIKDEKQKTKANPLAGVTADPRWT